MNRNSLSLLLLFSLSYSTSAYTTELHKVENLKVQATNAYNENRFFDAMPLLYAYIQTKSNLNSPAPERYHMAYNYAREQIELGFDILEDNLDRCRQGIGEITFVRNHDGKPSLKLTLRQGTEAFQGTTSNQMKKP